MDAREAILKARFFHPGETREAQVWDRVGTFWSGSPREAADQTAMMVEKRALVNTPAIANAGRGPGLCQGSACFVLPVPDTLEGIYQTVTDAAIVQKSGGGTGFSFTRLRGKGELIRSTGSKHPGVVPFMQMFSHSLGIVSQGGIRPGANMGVLNVDHPDIHEFIDSKQPKEDPYEANAILEELQGAFPDMDVTALATEMARRAERRRAENTITNFNISVGVDEGFMGRVLYGGATVDEQAIWDKIVQGAWANGEPGVLFMERINQKAPHPEPIEATNPCGEVPLLPYEACVLGSVNLMQHLAMNGTTKMSFSALEKTVRTMTRMLDNVIDRQDYPLPQIRDTHGRYRKIGVGAMGYSGALILMGHRYGSDRAIQLAEEWMQFIQEVSYDESERLGEERGVYPGWHPGMPRRRNACCQVIAPTGTISRLAGCDFSTEPPMDAEYVSFVVGGEFHERHPLRNEPAFVTAAQCTVEDHIRTLAAFQKYTDQAVSKTLNLPADATPDDVERTYRQAWEAGAKGCTVLRQHSREKVTIQTSLVTSVDCESGICPL